MTKYLPWALTLGTTNRATHALPQAHLCRRHRPQNPSSQPSDLYFQHLQPWCIPRVTRGQAHGLEPSPPAGAFGAARETERPWWGEMPEVSLRRGLLAWFRSPGGGRSEELGPRASLCPCLRAELVCSGTGGRAVSSGTPLSMPGPFVP